MSDDVFQGDQSNEREFLASDLDLFNLSTRYKKYWALPECSARHRAITILIYKGVSHETGDKIMEYIRASIGKKDIAPENFTMRDEKLKQWGMSTDKIQGIRKILALPEVTPQSLCKVKEGGIYLVKSFKILFEEDDDVFLNLDYNVLKCLGVLFFRDKPMTATEAMAVAKSWQGFRSQISYFLYRLKPEGAYKILEEEELDQYDFWGGGTRPAPASEEKKGDENPDDEPPQLIQPKTDD